MNKALMEDLLKLPEAERREIAQELWESLEESDLPPLTPEQMAEIDRRLEEHVVRFREFLRANGKTPEEQELIAAKLMGRWRCGAICQRA